MGITWLSKYYEVIDYRNRKVILKIPHQLEFQLKGECRSTEQGNRGDRVAIEARKKRIPVWDEFPDVFEESRGVSSDRIVEFFIDIILRTTPISRAPYRMAPIELAILKEQLQEYSNKGLIRSALHLWEHKCCLQIKRMVVRSCALTTGK